VIGNLEGTLTANDSIAQQDNSILRFTFDPHFAQLLADIGFSAVSLANNHALDFGEFGYEDTLHNLEAAQVAAFGAPYNDSHLALQLMIKDKKLCMVGYHSLFNPNTTAVIEKIQTIRSACDYVVVMAHWGVEYEHEPVAQQQDAAHAFIDAGADVVIGGHPHVVEPLEIYNGHAIFYSLGNFLFDQGWRPEVKRGLAVEVSFEYNKTRFTLTPVSTYEEVSVAGTTTAQAVLKDVVTQDLSPDIVKSILETGSFELENKAKTSPLQVI
jgi:poly-gamma-glutamate synthesis protein (capsule biosynthesis protein)